MPETNNHTKRVGDGSVKIPGWAVPFVMLLLISGMGVIATSIASGEAGELDKVLVQSIDILTEKHQKMEVKMGQYETDMTNIKDDIKENKEIAMENSKIIIRIAVKLDVDLN